MEALNPTSNAPPARPQRRPVADAIQVEQSDLKCIACAGKCTFSAVHQALECRSCGALYDLSTPEDDHASAEHPYHEDAPETDRPVVTDRRVHQCEGCGGEVLFLGEALSTQCPYCNGAVVLGTGDMGYRTKALIPFQADARFAQSQAQDWVKNRRAAPGDLGRVVAQSRVSGLYAPFWTFDSVEALQYWATYTKGSGDNRRTVKTSGRMHITFDDLLMPASPHVTPLIRDGILHDFDPADLRPYRAGYLAGFAAERHHQSVPQGLVANEDDKALLIRNRIKRHINKSGVSNIRYNTDTTGIHYRRILLPVWILHYEYGGKPMKVVVSGIDGRTFGERPFSMWKVAAYSALLSGIAIGLGWAWGVAGLP